jgi:hypothetical protein
MLMTRTVGFPVVVHIVAGIAAGIAHMLELFIRENAAESLQHHVQQQKTMNHFITVNQEGRVIKNGCA